MIPTPPTEYVAIDQPPAMGSPGQVSRRSPEPCGSIDTITTRTTVADSSSGEPTSEAQGGRVPAARQVETGRLGSEPGRIAARPPRFDQPVVTIHDLIKLARGPKSQIVDTLNRRWVGEALSARLRRRFCPPKLRPNALRSGGTRVEELMRVPEFRGDGLPIARYRARLVVKDHGAA